MSSVIITGKVAPALSTLFEDIASRVPEILFQLGDLGGPFIRSTIRQTMGEYARNLATSIGPTQQSRAGGAFDADHNDFLDFLQTVVTAAADSVVLGADNFVIFPPIPTAPEMGLRIIRGFTPSLTERLAGLALDQLSRTRVTRTYPFSRSPPRVTGVAGPAQ